MSARKIVIDIVETEELGTVVRMKCGSCDEEFGGEEHPWTVIDVLINKHSYHVRKKHGDYA